MYCSVNSSFKPDFCILRIRVPALFSVSSICGLLPAAIHKNRVNKVPSSLLPPVVLSQALDAMRSWLSTSLRPSSTQKYRPMKAGVWSKSRRAGRVASRIFGKSANTDCCTDETTPARSSGRPFGNSFDRRILSAAGLATTFFRRVATIFSKATQSGISVRPQASTSNAVRMTASASLPASSSSVASMPSASASQIAASITCMTWWRLASSAW